MNSNFIVALQRSLLALLIFLMANATFALGLGEPTLKSKLGEPLEMEVPVINSGDLSTEQLLVGAATNQQYKEFNIEHESIHYSMRYKVVERQNKLYVEITSQKPVKEPYINILLRLKWPEGEVLKALTVLLDTP